MKIVLGKSWIIPLAALSTVFTSCSSSTETTEPIQPNAQSSATTEPPKCNIEIGALKCDYFDFSRQNLDGAILAGGSFSYAKFQFASLVGTNFDGANLNQANFDNANLSKAVISRSRLEGASFQYANLTSAKIQDVCLKNLNFNFSDLTFADFARSEGNIFMKAEGSNLTKSLNWNGLSSSCEKTKP